MKGETIDEITGFAKGMRNKAKHVTGCEESIEIVGTGGDLANSFNISTTSSFVISAAGMPVAKHGNRSVSSKSGCGRRAGKPGCEDSDHTGTGKGIHSGNRYFLPVRTELSRRYEICCAGSKGTGHPYRVQRPRTLTNPASTNYILLGVYEKAMLPVMARVLLGLGIKSAMIVYGNDRLDEVSISDKTSVAEVRDGKITEYEIAPEDFRFPTGIQGRNRRRL